MKPKIIIINVCERSDAYPNVKYKVDYLLNHNDLETELIEKPLWPRKKGGTIHMLLKTIGFHLHLFAIPLIRRRPDLYYICYPGIFTTLAIRILDRKTKIFSDFFISAYDTLVNDRKKLKRSSIAAKLVFQAERTALNLSNLVITDTKSNALFLSSTYKIKKERFCSIPLSTNENTFITTQYTPKTKNCCSVLFVGTLIPLHGIEVICEAIQSLRSHKNIKFTIIGDGQCSHHLKRISHLENITWIKNWISSEEIREFVEKSDICLGIFGNTKKASRVIPYKIYAYSRIGRAIITGASPELQKPYFHTVSMNDSRALASEIIQLMKDPLKRIELAEQSTAFYNRYLSNQLAFQLLNAHLFASFNPRTSDIE